MDDLISRELALKESHKIVIEGEVFDVVQVESLLGLPSAEPERKKGKWIDVKINSYSSRTCCSECGSSAPFIYKSDDYYSNHAHGETARTKFCPNCGAKMENE